MEETKRVLEDRLAQCQKRMEQGLEAEAKLAEAQVFPLKIALFWVMFRCITNKGRVSLSN